jgi:hypothetical protein
MGLKRVNELGLKNQSVEIPNVTSENDVRVNNVLKIRLLHHQRHSIITIIRGTVPLPHSLFFDWSTASIKASSP